MIPTTCRGHAAVSPVASFNFQSTKESSRVRTRAFALGPEVSLPLERNGVLFGFVKANYQWETYARAGTQGAEFNIVATFLVKPLKLGKP